MLKDKQMDKLVCRNGEFQSGWLGMREGGGRDVRYVREQEIWRDNQRGLCPSWGGVLSGEVSPGGFLYCAYSI